MYHRHLRHGNKLPPASAQTWRRSRGTSYFHLHSSCTQDLEATAVEARRPAGASSSGYGPRQPGMLDPCAVCCCADINKAELAKHARRVVQRSAHMAAADRGHGLLISLSAHVTVGAAEWTGNDPHDFAFDEEAADAKEEAKAEDASPLRPPPGISRCCGFAWEWLIFPS